MVCNEEGLSFLFLLGTAHKIITWLDSKYKNKQTITNFTGDHQGGSPFSKCESLYSKIRSQDTCQWLYILCMAHYVKIYMNSWSCFKVLVEAKNFW